MMPTVFPRLRNSIAKLLTNEEHKDQLSIIDKELSKTESNIEFIIGVKYEIDKKRYGSLDNRKIAESDHDNPFYVDRVFL